MSTDELVRLLRQAAPSPSLVAWVLTVEFLDRVRDAARRCHASR